MGSAWVGQVGEQNTYGSRVCVDAGLSTDSLAGSGGEVDAAERALMEQELQDGVLVSRCGTKAVVADFSASAGRHNIPTIPASSMCVNDTAGRQDEYPIPPLLLLAGPAKLDLRGDGGGELGWAQGDSPLVGGHM